MYKGCLIILMPSTSLYMCMETNIKEGKGLETMQMLIHLIFCIASLL